MSDEASGAAAQIIAIILVASLWAGVFWAAWSIVHGWRP